MASKKKGIVWTEDDLRHFKAWQANVDLFIKRQGQRPRADQYDIYQTSPDVYVALTPADGIPAIIGPGTGTGTGTGSLDAGDGDYPGSATCTLHKLSLTTFRMEPVDRSVQVYNLSTAAIAGGSWVLVEQDPFGTWWATPTAVSSAGTSTPTAFSGASVFNSGFTTVASNSSTALPFDTKDYDTDSYWSSGDNTKLVAPAAGKYNVECIFILSVTAASYYQLTVVTNGGTTIAGQTHEVNTTPGTYLSAAGTWRPTAAGQYIRAFAFQFSGVNQSFKGWRFNIHRIE